MKRIMIVAAAVFSIFVSAVHAEQSELTPEQEGAIRSFVMAAINATTVEFYYGTEQDDVNTTRTIVVEAKIGSNDEYVGIREIGSDIYTSAMEAANDAIEQGMNDREDSA